MNYNILDLLKFFFAFAVIAIHSHVLEGQQGCVIEVLGMLELLAVPYFFIVSGFFLGRRLSMDNESDTYKKYIRRILKMYLIWCAIYLPINLYYELAIYQFSVPFTVFDLLRGWLLIGENPYSWPLWYLLASVVSVVLIQYLRKYKMNFNLIILTAIFLFLIGYFYSVYHDTFADMGAVGKYATNLYDKSFRTTRNGIFEGLLYISLGIALARNNSKTLSHLAIMGGGNTCVF